MHILMILGLVFGAMNFAAHRASAQQMTIRICDGSGCREVPINTRGNFSGWRDANACASTCSAPACKDGSAPKLVARKIRDNAGNVRSVFAHEDSVLYQDFGGRMYRLFDEKMEGIDVQLQRKVNGPPRPMPQVDDCQYPPPALPPATAEPPLARAFPRVADVCRRQPVREACHQCAESVGDACRQCAGAVRDHLLHPLECRAERLQAREQRQEARAACAQQYCQQACCNACPQNCGCGGGGRCGLFGCRCRR